MTTRWVNFTIDNGAVTVVCSAHASGLIIIMNFCSAQVQLNECCRLDLECSVHRVEGVLFMCLLSRDAS